MTAFATNGAPSDCVALAALGFLNHTLDLVVAGINQGSNMGHDVTYSGTVSAAMEGAISRIPSMAISLCGDSPWNFGEAVNFAASIGGRILAEGLPPNTFLNVNVPQGQVAGVEVTRLGHRVYRDALIKRRDPRGISYYWIGGDAPTGLYEKGTDIWAISRGCISVTPLQLDMTSYALLDELSSWDLNFTDVPAPAEASSESVQHHNLQGGES
jgi:5'-nucleotidase